MCRNDKSRIGPKWKTQQSPIVRNGRHSSPGHELTVQVLESKPDDQTYDTRWEGKTKSSKKTVRSRRVVFDNTPIVVRPPPCPNCTNHSPGVTQEVLSSLLPVIRQQAMQLQSQIMRENTRILTDVQDVTSDTSIRMPAATSTPIKPPLRPQSTSLPARAQYGTSAYGRPTYSAPPYSTPLSRSLPHTADRASQTKPKRTLAASFCGYPSDIEEDSDE